MCGLRDSRTSTPGSINVYLVGVSVTASAVTLLEAYSTDGLAANGAATSTSPLRTTSSPVISHGAKWSVARDVLFDENRGLPYGKRSAVHS